MSADIRMELEELRNCKSLTTGCLLESDWLLDTVGCGDTDGPRGVVFPSGGAGLLRADFASTPRAAKRRAPVVSCGNGKSGRSCGVSRGTDEAAASSATAFSDVFMGESRNRPELSRPKKGRNRKSSTTAPLVNRRAGRRLSGRLTDRPPRGSVSLSGVKHKSQEVDFSASGVFSGSNSRLSIVSCSDAYRGPNTGSLGNKMIRNNHAKGPRLCFDQMAETSLRRNSTSAGTPLCPPRKSKGRSAFVSLTGVHKRMGQKDGVASLRPTVQSHGRFSDVVAASGFKHDTMTSLPYCVPEKSRENSLAPLGLRTEPRMNCTSFSASTSAVAILGLYEVTEEAAGTPPEKLWGDVGSARSPQRVAGRDEHIARDSAQNAGPRAELPHAAERSSREQSPANGVARAAEEGTPGRRRKKDESHGGETNDHLGALRGVNGASAAFVPTRDHSVSPGHVDPLECRADLDPVQPPEGMFPEEPKVFVGKGTESITQYHQKTAVPLGEKRVKDIRSFPFEKKMKEKRNCCSVM